MFYRILEFMGESNMFLAWALIRYQEDMPDSRQIQILKLLRSQNKILRFYLGKHKPVKSEFSEPSKN